MDSIYYLFLCFTLSALSCASQEIGNDMPMSVRHENWMRRHGRIYKNEEEKECRFKIFKNNVEYIEAVNKGGNRKYKLGVNKFADLSREEFKAAYTGFKPRSYRVPKNTLTFRYENFTNVPSTVDWRKKGVVTPVKNQGECGSCWAFSSVAATEGLIKLKTGKLISLSEQQLIDCDVTEDNRGCHGGFMDVAFEFIKSKGLTIESEYPYEAKESKCKSKSQRYSFKIKGHEDVPVNSESSLMKAVANQPVSVGIDSEAIQFYESGVFTGECGTEIDHAVAAVGYGTDPDGTKYWLVKNSWGKSWGEEGYARIERGVEEAEGQCGIAVEASYPVA